MAENKKAGKGRRTISLSNYGDVVFMLESLATVSEDALNKTIREVKKKAPSWIAAAVVEQYNIKPVEIKPTSVKTGKKTAKKAGSIRAQGDTIASLEIVYKGRALTPLHFGMTPRKVKAPKKLSKKERYVVKWRGKGNFTTMTKGVGPYKITVEVLKGKRETLEGEYPTPWFLAPAKKGSQTQIPFQRIPDTEKGLAAFHTVSLPQMVESDRTAAGITKALETNMQKLIMKNLEKKLKF